MVYDVASIVRDVRIALDENNASEKLIDSGEDDALLLDGLIESKVVEGVRQVLLGAPTRLLEGGRPFGDAVYWRPGCWGWILLPDDFMRLVVFKMSDWERPVYKAITEEDARYSQQFSRYKGLRGNVQKPVVAICRRAEGMALELFACRTTAATVEQAVYIPYPAIDGQGGINIPKRCYQAAVYTIAALVLYGIGQADQAQLMQELGKNELIMNN